MQRRLIDFGWNFSRVRLARQQKGTRRKSKDEETTPAQPKLPDDQGILARPPAETTDS